MTDAAPQPLVNAIEDFAGGVLGAAVESSPVLMDLVDVGKFLVEHGNIIKAVVEAFEGGATSEQVLAAIKGSMVAASDAVVEAELGPRP